MIQKISQKFTIALNNKKFPYGLSPVDENTTFVECESANIKQEFLNKDIPQLLIDLPRLILAEKEYNEAQTEMIRFRVTPQDKKAIEKRAIEEGYSSISDFLRNLALSV